MRGSLFPLFPLFWWSMPCHLVKDMGHQNRGNRDPFMVLALHQGKTLRGSLFPLFPLRVKCQNHERVPISPISPILVVHVLTGWIDIGHQNRGNRDPFMVSGTSSRENTERVPISPISPKGEVPKPWEGLYFPYFPSFGGPCLGKMKR